MEAAKKTARKKVKTVKEKESSSAFFRSLSPNLLDWRPASEEEKAREVEARRLAREAELVRVTELTKEREAEKAASRKRSPGAIVKSRERKKSA